MDHVILSFPSEKGFKVGNTREKIEALGEGKKIVVVANAIAVRKGSKEYVTAAYQQ